MPRKRSEFKPLTEKEIIKKNPERKGLLGSKDMFKKLIIKGSSMIPFDKVK